MFLFVCISQHELDENLIIGLSEMFSGLCETCDVYPSNIVDVHLNCSALGLVYVSAGLVYSSPDGRITANTLLNGLQLRFLSQNNPSIRVNGTSVSLNKQCAPQLNNATQSACMQQLTSAVTQETESMVSTSAVIGSFAGGLAAGVVITMILITIIIW